MITVGIDEVGRGCWAGPLVAGAAILPPNINREDGHITQKVILKDSKQMTKKQGNASAVWINENAIVGLGWVWPVEIDEIGITASVRLAMERAIANITAEYDEIIIDGNINYFVDNPKAKAVIKADNSVASVSAASIAAKVARDSYMAELDESYDGYGFASHVGYGTAAHIAALESLGVSDIHRRSYKPIQALLT